MRSKSSALIWRSVGFGLAIALGIALATGFTGGSWLLRVLGTIVGAAVAAGLFWMINAPSSSARD